MTSKNEKLRVAIIGCGNIAGGFDLLGRDDAPKLTHAGGFADDDRFYIQACVDPVRERRAAFQEKWNIPWSFDTAQSLFGQKLDVISICSPTKHHVVDLDVAIQLKPKLIFCEKPIAPSFEAARDAVERCERAGVTLAVNYSRRWSADIRRLGKQIAEGIWGQVRSVSCLYNKGVFNNGAHMFDLLLYLFGDLDVEWAGCPVFDFWADDPSIPAVLITSSGIPITINIAHAADYALFELQLVTEIGVIAIEDGGLNWRTRHLRTSHQFDGYKSIDRGVFTEGTYIHVMRDAIANIYGAITSKEKLLSTGHSALRSLEYCERLKNLAVPNC